MENNQRAALYMIISALSFAFMQIAVKFTAASIPVLELVFMRNLFLIFTSIISIKKHKAPVVRDKKNIPLLFARGFFGMLGVVLYFIATKYLPSAEASILQKSSPFFVAIFAALFLKDKMTKIDVASMVIAFIGVIFVTKPTGVDVNIYSLFALLSAIFAAAAYVCISALKGKESSETIMFSFGIVTVVCILPFMLRDFVVPNLTEALGLIAIGIGGALGQYFLTLSYMMAPAGRVSIYNYSSVVFAAILGYFAFGDTIDIYSAVGILIIFIAAYLPFREKNKAKSAS